MGDSRVRPKKVSIHRRRWVRLAIVALALLVIARIFVFDIRQIPSNSMLPTLRGDEKNGDRVLLDLLTPIVRGPRRFEVVAFHDPQQKGRDLVKRVAGLPGETVLLRDGDLKINGKLYRKNAEERRRVRIPIFREKKHTNGLKDGFNITTFNRADELESTHWLRSRLHPEEGGMLYKSMIIPSDGFEKDDGSYAHRPGELPVFDLQLELPLRLYPLAAKFFLCFQHGGDDFIFTIQTNSPDGITDLEIERVTYPTVQGSSFVYPIKTKICVESAPSMHRGQVRRFVFSNVDCRISVEVDGKELLGYGLPFDYDTHTPFVPAEGGPKRNRSGIEFAILGGDIGASGEVNIYRDVVYEPRGTYGCEREYQLAKNQYYLLGDNSSDSTDSRVFGAVSGDEWIGYLRAIVSPWSRAGFIK